MMKSPIEKNVMESVTFIHYKQLSFIECPPKDQSQNVSEYLAWMS